MEANPVLYLSYSFLHPFQRNEWYRGEREAHPLRSTTSILLPEAIGISWALFLISIFYAGHFQSFSLGLILELVI